MMLLCASDEVDLSTRLQQCPDAQLPGEILAIKCKKVLLINFCNCFMHLNQTIVALIAMD